MKIPEYSYFPLEEYRERMKRLRAVMQEEGIDALIVTREENMVYFTGLLNQYWIATWDDEAQISLLTASEDKECSLFIGDGMEQSTRTSWVEDVRFWAMYRSGNKKPPVETVASAIKEKGLARGTIGMEIGRNDRMGMSVAFYEGLRKELPDAKFVSCYDIVHKVRAIKSERETEYIRRACDITCKGYEAGLKQVHEGMTEKELAHIICSVMLENNPDGNVIHPWTVFLHASGKGPTWWDGSPTDYKLKKGDTVWIDGGAIYRGYCSDMIRMACIGKPDKKIENYYEASRQGNMLAMEIIKPGVPCSELWNVFARKCKELGFDREIEGQLREGYSLLGHGIGVGIHEPPFLHSQTEGCLEEGMVLAIEAFVPDQMPFSKTRIALKIEENVLVTKDGYEWLTPLANHLYVG